MMQVIEAMIQNYRMKLEILEDLLNELKTEKNPVQHETKGSHLFSALLIICRTMAGQPFGANLHR